MTKRILSLAVVLLLCLTLMPLSASAEYHEEENWEALETVKHELDEGYILVQKTGGAPEADNQIIYVSPEVAGDVVIPAEVDEVPVEGIYLYTDEENEELNAYGFSKNEGITSLTLPGSMKSVDANSLPGGTDFTVTFEDGIEEFVAGDTLVNDNLGASKYVFPQSLKVLEGRLSDNPKLTIEMDSENPNFTTDEQGLLYTADEKTLVAAMNSGETAESYTIPYGVEEILTGAFRGSEALTDLYLPESIEKMEMIALYEGMNLHARSGGAVEELIEAYNTENGEDHSIVFVSTGEKLPYTDVSGWAVPYIGWAFDNGVMTGTSETTFSPERSMTRGMAVTTLFRLSNETSDYEHSFTDVPADEYYSEAVSWAAENGVVNGITDTSFAPEKNITREQLAVMLYRYAEFLGMDTTARTELDAYEDADSISDYALEALQWANAEELINGRTPTTLSPLGTTKRAEYATVLQRMIGNL